MTGKHLSFSILTLYLQNQYIRLLYYIPIDLLLVRSFSALHSITYLIDPQV